MRVAGWLVLGMLVLMFAGCPDYSQLRPVPDYENMTDGATETNPESAGKNPRP